MTDSEVSSPESEASHTGSDGKTRQTPSTSAGVGRRKLFESALSDKTNVSAQDLILKEVRKTNSSLAEFSTRMDAMENRLKSVEEQQKDMTTPSSSGDSSTERVKRKVPTRIRHEVRDVYRTLMENENFDGFAVKKRFADKENQDIVKRLCSEMKTLDPTVSPTHIRDAARRFFQTKVEEDSLKTKGKYSDKVKKQRKRNRINRKYDQRKATLLKSTSMPEEQKAIAKQIVIKEFMSSESSAVEQLEDGTERPVIAVKQLQWRGAKATRFLKRLDAKATQKKSKQSIQQTLPRVFGGMSTRPKPDLPDDFWGFTAK